MTRLPTPGADANNWGSILNDFLDQAHNPDGTLKDVGVVAAKADDSTVIHNSGAETIAGTKTFSASPIVPTPTSGSQATTKTYVDSTVSAGAPDASTTTKGIVQLTNDLGGTATAPTVPALAGKYTKPGGGIPRTDLAAAVQTSLTTADNRDAVKLQGTSVSATAPTDGQLLTYTASGTAWAPATPTVAGPVPDATTTSKGLIELAGDLSGTATSPTVPGLAAKATDTAVVHNTGAEMVAGVKTFTSSPTVPAPTSGTDATNKTYVDAQVTGGGTPDATATTEGKLQLAGDLSGTAASPSVAKVNGVAVSGTPSSGQVITASSGSAAAWTTPAAGFSNPTATKGDLIIHGTSSTTRQAIGSDGQILTADSTQATGAKWAAAPSAPVQSVAGKTGTVTLVEADIASLTSDLAATEKTANKGQASGYAGLDAGTKVPTAQLGGAGADSTKFLRGDQTWTTTPTASNATSSTPGLIQLAGDLAGTATSPTVPGLTSKVGSVAAADGTVTVGGTATAPTVGVNAIPESKVTNLTTDLAATEKTANKDQANGYAGLDGSGLLKTSELPSSVVSGSLNLAIDGAGSAITTGIKGDLIAPFAGTITGWTISADQSGSAVVDVWKTTFAGAPPTVANTITGSALPTLTTAQKATSTALTGWTLTFAKGDILRFNVNSAATVTRLSLSLAVTKS